MKRKIQLKPVRKTPKWFTNQVNMCLAQKILGKYGVSRWKGRLLALIFRQYPMLLAGTAGETDSGDHAAVKNYNHYLNVYKSLFNLTTQAIEPLHTKSKKVLPVPLNLLKNTQGNNLAYSGGKQGSEKEVSKLKYKGFLEGELKERPGRGQKEHKGYGEAGIFSAFTAANLFKQISENYSKTLRKKVAYDFEFSYLFPGLKGQDKKEEVEAKWIEPQQTYVLIPSASKALPIADKQLKAFMSPIQYKDEQYFPFSSSQGQGVDLLYNKKSQSEWEALASVFPKRDTLGRQDFVLPTPYKNKQYFPFGNSQKQNVDLVYDKDSQSEWKALTPAFPKQTTLERQALHNRISHKTGENKVGYSSSQFPLKEPGNADFVMQSAKKTRTLRASTSVEKEKPPENRKEAFQQSEMILHDSTLKAYGFLKGTLSQAAGVNSRFLNVLSKRQAADNFEQGFLKENMLYRSIPELIPARARQDRQAAGISRPFLRAEVGELWEKYEDSSLIFRKPQINDAQVETGQAPKGVLPSEKEVYERALAVSKPRKNTSAIGTEEVDLLAEKVLKVLEKRMSIQKDRRGLR